MIPLRGIPELEEGDDLAALVVEAAARGTGFEQDDVLVVAQKAVSKVEGRVVQLADVEPSERARELAGDSDPRRIEVILGEAREVLRARPPLVIAETRHGFVCASAGVDASNAKGPDTLVLLPLDPDASAARLRSSDSRAHRRRDRRHRLGLVRTRVAARDHRRRARCRGHRGR